jgi:hydroxymethylglutaryl-CoA reductase (NADPH)
MAGPLGRGLGAIAGRVTRYPIETAVFYFVLTTLAYFHVLSAIKHSHFLTPSQPISSASPVLAYKHATANEWSTDSSYFASSNGRKSQHMVDIVQIVPAAGTYPSLDNAVSVSDELIFGVNYSSACYRHNASCLTAVFPHTLSFALRPSQASSFIHTITTSPLRNPADGSVFEAIRSRETIADMKSGKWIAYAGRALVVRFWSLAKVRSPDSTLAHSPQFPIVYNIWTDDKICLYAGSFYLDYLTIPPSTGLIHRR